MTVLEDARTGTSTAARRLCLVSCDCHIGPTMDLLRPYVPRGHLDTFDEWTVAHEARMPRGGGTADDPEVPPEWLEKGWSPEHRKSVLRHVASTEPNDGEVRRRDLDDDGIAAEVIFHGSQNGEPLPFTSDFGLNVYAPDLELGLVGVQTYNRWLADFCSQDPARHGGLAQLPFWDPEASTRELAWARDAGLVGVNFPAIRPWDTSFPLYTDAAWEPFFATAESLRMPLASHASGLDQVSSARYQGIGNMALQFAYGAVNCRQTAWWIIFTGILQRHPGLRYVITETVGDWLVADLRYMDSVYEMDAQRELRKVITKSPSEYFHENVYMGASMMSNREAHRFVDELGLRATTMWGADYPHKEGTWPYTALSLRKTFHDIPEDVVRDVCARNAIELYGFDADKLAGIAERIGPAVEELARTVEHAPEGLEYSYAFREDGPFT